jgi:hypothetical protein
MIKFSELTNVKPTSISLDESKRVEIDKKEYDTIHAQHHSAKANNRTGKYAAANYVYTDKEHGRTGSEDRGGVVSQTYSHDVHKLPTIEKAGAKHYKYVNEAFYVDGDENETTKDQRKVYDTQTKAFKKDAKENAAQKAVSEATKPMSDEEKKKPFNYAEWKASSVKPRALPGWGKKGPITKMVASMKNVKESEELDEGKDVQLNHKVGDTVWAKTQHAWSTKTGKVTKIGRTHTTITHKDGSSGTYPHKDVSLDYPHKNPYHESEEMTKVSFKEFINEGLASKIANKIMGVAPTKPKYKVGQKVSYEMHPPQEGGSGTGHIESYKNGHYLVNGKPINHHEIKKVHESEDLGESARMAPGKKVWTSHTDSPKQGSIVGKDTDNKNHYIVKHSDGEHSVHQDHIHFSKEHAGYMYESEVNEAIKMSDYHAHSEKSQFKNGHRPHITYKSDPKRTMYLGQDVYKTKEHAKGHAEAYLKGYADIGPNHADRMASAYRKEHAQHIVEGTEMQESSPFDWKGKASIFTKKDDTVSTETGTKHKGTYGSDDHKVKGDGSAPVKRGRGRPAGSYNGEYKKRDPAGKAASAAKAMASKAEGLKIRGEYKQAMNDAIKKRQAELHAKTAK